jgi:arylformamidase
MEITLKHQQRTYKADLSKPIDLTLALLEGLDTVNCFWAPPVRYEPYRDGNFIGSVEAGAPVNFYNIHVNPHGNGTHTECVGHISRERYRLRECLRDTHCWAYLCSVYPEKTPDGDRVIYPYHLSDMLAEMPPVSALILRTLPNDDLKRSTNYSGANAPYLHHSTVALLVAHGIEHLLVDLPSVDRESDEGQLLAHKAFWCYPDGPVRTHCTITELMYAPNTVHDGLYLLNLQIAAFDIDVSPSRVLLYAVEVLSEPMGQI